MKLHHVLLTLLLTALPMFAGTKTFTVLGDKKVRLDFDGKMPRASVVEGVKTDATGFIMDNRELIPSFGFEYKNSKTLKKVLVEEVSGKQAHVMVEDLTPKIEKGRWMGNSKPIEVSRRASPWIFATKDTTMIFRFTLEFEEDPKPLEIYQAAVFGAETKGLFQLFEKPDK